MKSSSSTLAAKEPVPLWLSLFCFALMGPAMGINAAFLALAIPAMARFGTTGLIAAGLVGTLIGIFPARWLARKIHEGISE
jgi:flagellar motor component MotA